MSKCLGYEALAVSSSAVAPALTPLTTTSLKQQLAYISIVVESNTVRYRGDGTAPTASVGTPLIANASMTYDDPGAICNGGLKFIRASADATVHIEYFAAP